MSTYPSRERASATGPGAPMSVLAVIAPLVLLGVIVLLRRRNTSSSPVQAAAAGAAHTVRGGRRRGPQRLMLTTAINLLENDMGRRGVLIALKLLRDRL